MTDYLTVAEVLAMHADQVERYGGSQGVRDHGLLEAALYRPQTGYYADLIEEAAALWESLSQNHPFLDGNKRTAVAVMAAFLRVNGYKLEFEDIAAFKFLMEIYENHKFRFGELEAWLREHARPLR